MTVKELKALLENIVDDLPVLYLRDNVFTEITEDDIDVVTFDAGRFIGPTALAIFTTDDKS